MKNKVDIGKLIEKKYKGNTLELSDILEQIDLVLQETSDYKYNSKIDTGDLEENPESVSISQRMYGAQGSRNQRPDDLGYGDNVNITPSVRPTTVAEGGEGSSQQAKTYTVQVPDLFSMITNSEMEPNDEDRKLIKRIVLNLKDVEAKKGNWIERIKAINKFTEDAQGNAAQYEGRDIRRAVSNLIFLNLLKKISFFVAQPGKLFEYIIAPLIGTEAKVVGSVDQDIIDITKESQGKVWDYSVKLFTGKKSGFDLKGSRDKLKAAIDLKNAPITYIIAVSDVGSKTIQFSELRVSDRAEHFSASPLKQQPVQGAEEPKPEKKEFAASNEWGKITTVGSGIILKNEQENAVGVYIPTAEDQNKMDDFLPYAAKQARKIDRSKNIIEFGGQRDTYENFQKLSNLFGPIKTELDPVGSSTKYLNFLNLQKPESKTPNATKFRTALKDAVTYINKYSDQVMSPDITSFYWTSSGKDTQQQVAEQEQVKAKVNQVKQLFLKLTLTLKSILATEFQKMKTSSDQEKQVKENINFQVNEQPKTEQKPKSAGEFSVRLQGSWANLVSLSLNLGDPKVYNQQQLKIVSDLAEDMNKVLSSYQELNTNLVSFFATSKESQKSITKSDTGFGDKVIQNAEDIKSGVNGLLEKEGTPSKLETE